MSDTHTNDKRADDAEHVKVLGQADALIRAVFAPAPGLPPAELRQALASTLKASAAPTAAAAHGAPAELLGELLGIGMA
jgi:hypothetical protein